MTRGQTNKTFFLATIDALVLCRISTFLGYNHNQPSSSTMANMFWSNHLTTNMVLQTDVLHTQYKYRLFIFESHSWSLTVIFTPWFSSPLHGSFCAMIMTVWFLSGPWFLLVMCSHLDSLVSVNTMTNITGQLEGRSMGTLLKIQVGFIMDHCF